MGCGRVFLQDLNGFIIFVIIIEGCNGQVRMGHGGTGDATAAPLAVLGAIPVGFGELFLTLLLMIVGCTRPSPVETSGSNPRRVLEHAVQPGLALGQEVLVGAYASKFGVSSASVPPPDM